MSIDVEVEEVAGSCKQKNGLEGIPRSTPGLSGVERT